MDDEALPGHTADEGHDLRPARDVFILYQRDDESGTKYKIQRTLAEGQRVLGVKGGSEKGRTFVSVTVYFLSSKSF